MSGPINAFPFLGDNEFPLCGENCADRFQAEYTDAEHDGDRWVRTHGNIEGIEPDEIEPGERCHMCHKVIREK